MLKLYTSAWTGRTGDGEEDINIFMLSIVYKGIALPLVWTLLSKRGNSNIQERIEVMKKLFELLGK